MFCCCRSELRHARERSLKILHVEELLEMPYNAAEYAPIAMQSRFSCFIDSTVFPGRSLEANQPFNLLNERSISASTTTAVHAPCSLTCSLVASCACPDHLISPLDRFGGSCTKLSIKLLTELQQLPAPSALVTHVLQPPQNGGQCFSSQSGGHVTLPPCSGSPRFRTSRTIAVELGQPIRRLTDGVNRIREKGLYRW